MNLSFSKFQNRPGSAEKKPHGKGWDGIVRGIVALERAVKRNRASVVRINGRRVAIVPLEGHPRLERLLEQKEKAREAELDRLDVEEAERILNDPTQVSIPYEQVRRELGLGGLSD